ncbi:hypothetical protein QLH32_15655 [Acinetobacter corruptisaponis]|uniref:Uncharacterized protein n=1 Tax=Acinetobacter corruptisaponis TaxID=3045147 RepID=A0ABY8S196_9GAMM|nr:hypothetical protein [Acinetobacter sp. KCTC 92772]WHP05428.1 hypothetical protein QLH32_15655 [Acinetobacter sp. KCTC 92772]
MSTICLNGNYSTFSLNQLECLYDGFDPASSAGLDYYGNDNALEDQLTKELDDLLLSCEKETAFTTITTTSTNEEIRAVNADLQRRHKNNVKQLETAERNKICNIKYYNRLSMKNAGITIKACIDFIDVKFETAKPFNRSVIKKYLTEKTGIRHFIKTVGESDDVLRDEESNNLNDNIGTAFVIRLHDVKNLKALTERLSILKYYNLSLNVADLEIVRIERAIDFSNAPHFMRIALLKAVQLSKAENCRFYNKSAFFPKKEKTGGIFSIFNNFNDVRDGNTIYINNKDDDHYYRIYFKTTDFNKRPLKVEDHRVRFEENYSGSALLQLNDGRTVTIRDIETVIKAMSKALIFTRLRDDALPYFKSAYRDIAKPYGLERESVSVDKYRVKKRRDKYGNETRLLKYLETHIEFNQVIAKVQHKLAEKFKVKN